MKCALLGWGYWGKIIEKYINESIYFSIKYILDTNIHQNLTLEDILYDKEVECVFVCTPIVTHYNLVKKLLNYKKHVFCEKPLCKNLYEVNELFKIANINKVCLYTDYIYTNSRAINYMKRNINDIGDIIYIKAAIRQFGNFYKDDNVYEVLGVHMISAILHCLSEYNLENFVVEKNVIIRESSDNFKALDGILEFSIDKRIYGIIECSLASIYKCRTLEFIGNKGVLRFDMLSENTVEKIITKDEGCKVLIEKQENIMFDESNNLKFALENFAEAIKMDEKLLDNSKISLLVTKILEKIK